MKRFRAVQSYRSLKNRYNSQKVPFQCNDIFIYSQLISKQAGKAVLNTLTGYNLSLHVSIPSKQYPPSKQCHLSNEMPYGVYSTLTGSWSRVFVEWQQLDVDCYTKLIDILMKGVCLVFRSSFLPMLCPSLDHSLSTSTMSISFLTISLNSTFPCLLVSAAMNILSHTLASGFLTKSD